MPQFFSLFISLHFSKFVQRLSFPRRGNEKSIPWDASSSTHTISLYHPLENCHVFLIFSAQFLRYVDKSPGIFRYFCMISQHLQACLRNRKSRQRLDRHGTIVAERCETFRYCCIVGCQNDKRRVETSGGATGLGGTNPGMPQQRSLRKRMVPTAGCYNNHSWQVSQVLLFLLAEARILPS